MSAALPRAVAIVGPTAAGKEALGRRIALRVGSPVLVCDSVKVHRGLDIGTSKPDEATRAEVEHRLLDLVDPDADFSAGDYAEAAWAELAREGGVGLFVGGTGLYLRATAFTVTDVQAVDRPLHDPARRAFAAHWDAQERLRPGAIHSALTAADPETAATIDPRNLVRAQRALWLCERLGRPVSAVRRADPPRPRLRLFMVVLDPGVAELDARIDVRLSAMLAAGWLDEVESLLRRGYDERHKAMRSLGYRQLIDVVRGRQTMTDARADILAATRHYARRQRTYFRHQIAAEHTAVIRDAAACPDDRLAEFLAEPPEGAR